MTRSDSPIHKRLDDLGPGAVVTATDFLDLAQRAAVDQALSRLARDGKLRRLARGLYHAPRISKRLGVAVSPDVDDIARAVARKSGARIASSGARAANHLGLSLHVPAQYVYMTDGRSRRVKVGNVRLTFKHTSPKYLPGGDPVCADVVQALRFLGSDGITDDVVSRLRAQLSPAQLDDLKRAARSSVSWISDAMYRVADAASGGATDLG